MGLKIGEVDIASQIIDNEFQIHRLYGLIDCIISKTNVEITEEEFKRIEEDSLIFLQEKYPNSGIVIKRKEDANASKD